MKKSVLTAKSMVEIYVNYGLSKDTWEMFYNMTCHGLISGENWTKFSEICIGLQYDSVDGRTIIDTSDNGKVVYEMNNDGFYIKVK